ncbi:MAG: LysM peptidoglycan-binding domain-containing protein [Anaerolineae bacterium]
MSLEEGFEKGETRAETKYTVKSGDTLQGIAEKFYDDASRWSEIYEANKDLIADPDKISIGMELRIPLKEKPKAKRPRKRPPKHLPEEGLDLL